MVPAVHASGRWQRSPADHRLDGALLLPALRGAVPADDQRTTTTIHAYIRELVEAGYAYRFDVAQRQLRGNLPQAFVHALLLESAARLTEIPGLLAG